MSRRAALTALFAFVLVVSVSGGGIVHAVVPHDHHEGTGTEESSIWTSLHGALRHEQKKLLFDVIALLATVIAVLCMVRLVTVRWNSVESVFNALLFDPLRGSALRRGTLAYRRFG